MDNLRLTTLPNIPKLYYVYEFGSKAPHEVFPHLDYLFSVFLWFCVTQEIKLKCLNYIKFRGPFLPGCLILAVS